MKINEYFYNRMREAELEPDDDGYGIEVIVRGHCRSTIRGTVAERLRWRAFLNELHFGRDDPRYGQREIR